MNKYLKAIFSIKLMVLLSPLFLQGCENNSGDENSSSSVSGNIQATERFEEITQTGATFTASTATQEQQYDDVAIIVTEEYLQKTTVSKK